MKETLIEFQYLKPGEQFDCFGDEHCGFKSPEIVKCIKIAEDKAQIIDGMSFYMNETDKVFTNNKSK